MNSAVMAPRRVDARGRGHAGYVAFIVHRVSGLALAFFLPLHFWALGSALAGKGSLDAFLAWTRNPLVKIAETLLVLALAAHLGGGLRLLFIEFVGWRADSQKTMFAAILAGAIACALLFALNVA
jgi:fumarate reductase subunit D